MSIEIETEVEIKLDFDYTELITAVINEALAYVECPYEASVNVLLTDKEAIREMNRQYREIDRSTDVLSFPMVDYEIPADFSRLEEDPDAYFDPDSGELLLGDIVISMETMSAQAREYGHTEKRELAFLVAHSMLHLSGYDHMEDGEREIMEEKQEAILRRLHLTREEQRICQCDAVDK